MDDIFHLLFHDSLNVLNLLCQGVKEQFVVDLEHHAALEAFLPQPPVHTDHCKFYDVGRSTLDRSIHSIPFSERANGGIPGIDIRQVTPPSEKRLDIAALPCRSQRIIYVRGNRREILEIVVDDFLRLAYAQLQSLGKPEC